MDNILIGNRFFINSLRGNKFTDPNQHAAASGSMVHPAVLLWLSIFVPGTQTAVNGEKHRVDVSAALSSLMLSHHERYDQIQIRGERLNILTDFSVWMGIIAVFSEQGAQTNTVTLPFPVFAHLCGFESHEITQRLRLRIFEALTKIGSKVIQFHRRKDGKKCFTHMLKNAEFDPSTDTLTLQTDERLWEIY
ncbi:MULTISPECIES: hypothetical protein [Yersiniaceae]|uniref:Replication initiation protein n=1 Tax=Chimaeribacter arupi TaxID=2060066 RepID=A0A2N5EKW1_9GAMM|nr:MULTISPECIES: hypothetical protein [Yersiniaceae]MDV5142070.1 hypothetical protein [Chimaeribacter arupi]PLR47373.1 hypothetical protein CYR34_14580 [Chimaeribacter arupi]